MSKLMTLKNIGKTTAGWLHEVGIYTRADLQAVGPVEAYRRIKSLHPDRVTLNALYALEGALMDISCKDLPEEANAELRAAAGE